MNAFWRKLCDEVGRTDYVSMFADPSRKIVNIDDYTYTVDGNAMTANITQTAPQVFNTVMDTDSDFVLFYFSGMARNNGSTVLAANPAISIQIKDQSSGRNFFNTASAMPFVCGQGGFPFLLTSPRVIKPRTTLTLTAQSLQNQAFYGFFFCYHGARIFYEGAG